MGWAWPSGNITLQLLPLGEGKVGMGCSDTPRYKKSVILSNAKDLVTLLDTYMRHDCCQPFCMRRVGA
jgi:hypothetical protein